MTAELSKFSSIEVDGNSSAPLNSSTLAPNPSNNNNDSVYMEIPKLPNSIDDSTPSQRMPPSSLKYSNGVNKHRDRSDSRVNFVVPDSMKVNMQQWQY